MDDKLAKIKAALNEIASQEEKKRAAIEARNHLTAADYEMFNRIMARAQSESELPLSDRVIMMKREANNGERSILGLRMEGYSTRGTSKRKPSKKSAVLDGNEADGLSRLHARLRSLRATGGGSDGAT